VSPLDRADIPPPLRGLRIGVLVSGGVAAYKVADLVSQLTQEGCPVRVALTPNAARFVGTATFQGISGHPVLTDLWPSDAAPEPHVELGDWAQVILVAPATANTLAKLAQGLADDMVSATVLAARCPVVVAPAMNDAMWAKPQVVANVAKLRQAGFHLVEPATGRLASGHQGPGRLPEAATLLRALAGAVQTRNDYTGRQVVVTAGGTREPVDPVRFIGNQSSGKMGHALAVAAAERGARVTLVTTVVHPEHAGIGVRTVSTAREMLDALREEIPGADVLLMAAAVGDFRPAETAEEKIHRQGRSELWLRLEPNVDVLAELADVPDAQDLYRVGFAAEGADLENRAAEKLAHKKLDAIVANDIRRPDIAFGAEHNAGLMLLAEGTRIELERMTKREMADRILDAILPRLSGR
jgi:phosphopantothenoylcysteine decarboxylase/phosphopantothenate--cysteine ligase